MIELFEVSFSGLDFWLNMLDRVKQVYAEEASPKGGREHLAGRRPIVAGKNAGAFRCRTLIRTTFSRTIHEARK